MILNANTTKIYEAVIVIKLNKENIKWRPKHESEKKGKQNIERATVSAVRKYLH